MQENVNVSHHNSLPPQHTAITLLICMEKRYYLVGQNGRSIIAYLFDVITMGSWINEKQ